MTTATVLDSKTENDASAGAPAADDCEANSCFYCTSPETD
jgi:hypothetical protein